MEIVILISKLISLFIGVWMTILNVGNVQLKYDVSGRNVILQTIGISVFIWLQFCI